MPNVEDLIQTDQPVLTGACALYPFDEKLAKKFTVMSRFDDPVSMWSQSNGFIRLPRAVCPIGKSDKRLRGNLIEVEHCIKPRNDEQERVIGEIEDLVDAEQSFLCQLPTGFGKTLMGCIAIARYSRKAMIVVPKTDLLTQWVDAVKKFLRLPADRIGFVRQDRFDVTDKDVVIGMLHSLAIEDRYPSWLRNEFGIVIFDEVQKLAADHFSTVCSLFPSMIRLGLSATPERADGKEIVFLSHIGPVRVKADAVPMQPKILRYTSKWRCPRVPVWDDKRGKMVIRRKPHTAGKTKGVEADLIRDFDRNEILATWATVAYQKGRNVIVWSDWKEHLEQLKAMVEGMGVPSDDTSYYVGDMNTKQLDHAKGKRVLFSTYQMMDYGTDIPWMDCGIMATPRSAVKQIVGRLLREYEGKPTPVVFDLIDDDSPVFSGYAGARFKYYQEIGATIQVKGHP